jgi:hypothetical protein
VTVYPDDNNKPAEGEELNCQAIISLLGVYPIDRSISNSGEEVTDPDRLIEMNYGNYLRDMTKKFHGKFIDYDVYTGTWTFKVKLKYSKNYFNKILMFFLGRTFLIVSIVSFLFGLWSRFVYCLK